MNLPTQKTPPQCSLNTLTALVYGPPKIGKSTFASKAPNALFLATEPGLNALEVYQLQIATWKDFLAAIDEIAKGNHGYRTIVIDTLDMLYRLCADSVCRQRGVIHESDGAHGNIYGLIKVELQRALTRLANLPYGLILICHSKERDMETKTGVMTRTVPTLSESFREVVNSLVDIILFCDFQVEKDEKGTTVLRRVMRTKAHPNYDAGDRFHRLPEIIDLDFDAFAQGLESVDPSSVPSTPSAATAPTEMSDDEINERFAELAPTLGAENNVVNFLHSINWLSGTQGIEHLPTANRKAILDHPDRFRTKVSEHVEIEANKGEQ